MLGGGGAEPDSGSNVGGLESGYGVQIIGMNITWHILSTENVVQNDYKQMKSSQIRYENIFQNSQN